MKQPKGMQEYGQAGCCPTEFNHIPEITGNHEMDLGIMHCKNKDAHAKLSDHLTRDVAYEKNTAYTRSSND
jgi:hypothetical protein